MAKRKSALDEPCLWERQEGESEAAWKAFLAFRDMQGKRTVTAVVKECEKSRSLIDRWRKRWYWDKRVLAYDNDIQKQAHDEAVKTHKAILKNNLGIAARLQKKAAQALERLDPDDLSPKEIREYVKLAAEMERMARQNLGGEFQEETEDEKGEQETVHIYLPDNGRF